MPETGDKDPSEVGSSVQGEPLKEAESRAGAQGLLREVDPGPGLSSRAREVTEEPIEEAPESSDLDTSLNAASHTEQSASSSGRDLPEPEPPSANGLAEDGKPGEQRTEHAAATEPKEHQQSSKEVGDSSSVNSGDIRAGRDAFTQGERSTIAETVYNFELREERFLSDFAAILNKRKAVDPTVLMEGIPSPIHRFDECLVDQWLTQLRLQRIIVLTCFDEGVLLSAGYQLAEQFAGSTRQIHLNRIDEERRLELTANHLADSRLIWPRPTIILAATSSFETSDFIDSIMKGDSHATGVSAQLKSTGRFLVVLASPDQTHESTYLQSISVPFLRPYLRNRFPDHFNELASAVEALHVEGRWNIHSQAFFENLRRCQNAGQLLEVIERRSAGHGFAEERCPEIASSAPLETMVLFIATFFRDLPLEDFQSLLKKLLGDKTKAKEPLPLGDSDESQHEKVEQTLLADIWTDEYVEILERCQLAVYQVGRPTDSWGHIQPQGPVVGFRDAIMRERVEAEFFSRRYLTLVQIFAEVRRLGILHSKARTLVDGICYLTERMAEADLSRYGVPVLLEVAEPIISATSAGSRAEGESFVWGRLYMILRTFLRNESLGQVVDAFLTALINQKFHTAALELVRRLRNVAEFDQISWWKQLLDRGESEAKAQTAREIVMRLEIDSSQATATLQRIAGWLPGGGENPSQSAEQANLLLHKLLIGSLWQSRSREVGTWPLHDPVLLALASSEGIDDEKGRPLISWLLHPSFLKSPGNEPGLWLNAIVHRWILDATLYKVKESESKCLVLERQCIQLAVRWKEQLKKIGGEFGGSGQARVSELAPVAIILADYALSIDQVEAEAAEHSLRQLLATTASSLTSPMLRASLRAHWSAMRNFLADLADHVQPADDKEYRRVMARLKSQSRSLARISTIFRNEVNRLSLSQEESNAPAQ